MSEMEVTSETVGEPEVQQFIEGTRDAVPPDVQLLAEQYVSTLRARMQMQVLEKDQKEQVRAKMAELDIETIDTLTDVVKREPVADKIKVSKKSEDE